MSNADYRVLLTVPFSIADEHGMPFALYHGRSPSEFRPRRLPPIVRPSWRLQTAPCRSRRSCRQRHLLLRRVDEAVAPPGQAKSRPRRDLIARRLADVEHALALQRDIQMLIAQWKTADGVWLPHGSPVWLVGASSEDSLRGRLVAPCTRMRCENGWCHARVITAAASGSATAFQG